MPLTTFVVFTSFVVYVDLGAVPGRQLPLRQLPVAALLARAVRRLAARLFGPWRWPWLPFIKYSPAMLILVFPLAFRMTCYYYRGAYYKAFWADPPACAVGEPRNEYRGEAKWPLLIQNLHRYALYFALIFIVLLSIDVVKGFRFNNPATGHAKFGDRASARSCCSSTSCLIGGLHASAATRSATWSAACSTQMSQRAAAQEGLRLRELPQPPPPEVGLVQPVSGWGCTDVYIRLCAMGVIHDLRIF